MSASEAGVGKWGIELVLTISLQTVMGVWHLSLDEPES